MTDVILVAILLVIGALVTLIFYARKQKKGAVIKSQMSWQEFFVSFIVLLNSFIVIVMGLVYVYGMQITQSWLIAILMFVFGIGGIVFAFLDRFTKRKVEAARLAQK